MHCLYYNVTQNIYKFRKKSKNFKPFKAKAKLV